MRPAGHKQGQDLGSSLTRDISKGLETRGFSVGSRGAWAAAGSWRPLVVSGRIQERGLQVRPLGSQKPILASGWFLLTGITVCTGWWGIVASFQTPPKARRPATPTAAMLQPMFA